MSIHILINGDRKLFKSKTAIIRFKKDIKINKGSVNLDSSKYFKENCNYSITINDNKYIIELYEKKKLAPDHLVDLKAKLKNKLNGLKNNRKNIEGKKIKNVKKNVPKNIFESFLKLKQKMPHIKFDNPADILKNPEKYKERFKDLASSLNETDIKTTDLFRSYIYKMVKELGLEEYIGKQEIDNKVIKEQEIDNKVIKAQVQAQAQAQAQAQESELESGSISVNELEDGYNIINIEI